MVGNINFKIRLLCMVLGGDSELQCIDCMSSWISCWLLYVPISEVAWLLYKCAAMWMAVHGASSTERLLITICKEREKTFSLLQVSILPWHDLIRLKRHKNKFLPSLISNDLFIQSDHSEWSVVKNSWLISISSQTCHRNWSPLSQQQGRGANMVEITVK